MTNFTKAVHEWDSRVRLNTELARVGSRLPKAMLRKLRLAQSRAFNTMEREFIKIWTDNDRALKFGSDQHGIYAVSRKPWDRSE